MAFYIGGLDTMTKNWASSYFSLTDGLSAIGTFGSCWGINLRITSKKPDPNRTFFMDFGAFFVWILRSVGTFGALSITYSSHTHAYFLIDVQKSHFSSNFEKVPKSMKNVRFGSGFLHVIHKLTLQDNPTFIYYQLTLYAAV